MSDLVSELLGLRFQIGLVMLVGRDLDRDAVDDLESVAVEPDDLPGVIRQELELPHPEVTEDLCAQAVVSEIRLKAQVPVRLDRVHALVLELVGADLVAEANPAPLVPAHID